MTHNEKNGSSKPPSADDGDHLRRENDSLQRRLAESQAEVDRLRKDNEKLNQDNDKLREQLVRLQNSPGVLALSDRTAEAAGVPSSKTFYRRPTAPAGERKPSGGQPGHPGKGRRRPTPNRPPIELTLDHCPDCKNPLAAPSDWVCRTVTDLPEVELEVHEERRARYHCACGARPIAATLFPAYQQYGPRLIAFVAHHRMLGLSVQKIQGLLQEYYDLAISEAALLAMERHAGQLLGTRYTEIQQQVRQAGFVHGDETRFRVNGENGWLWTFSTMQAVLYEVANTRGHTVPERVLKGFKGVLVRDAWDPYDKVDCQAHQLDLVHINRWLERAEVKAGVDPRPLLAKRSVKLRRRGRPPEHLLRFVDAVRDELREAVAFVQTEPGPTEEARKQAYERCVARFKAIVEDPGPHRDAVRIAKELRSRIDMVFTFVRIVGVPWNNNEGERAIRQGVLHRKIAGGRRTWGGASTFHTLLSVFETCKKSGENFVAFVDRLARQATLPGSATPSDPP